MAQAGTSKSLILVDYSHSDSGRSDGRIAILDEKGRLDELTFESGENKSCKHSIYLGKITRVEHALQAAFVDFGGSKHGFLPFSEIHPDYYQIPTSCQETLKEQISNEQKNNSTTNLENADLGATAESGDEDVAEIGDIGLSSDDKKDAQYKLYQKYSIQEVIKRGQNVLVQVFKDERSNKGVSLTTYISLIGRYCIFLPNSPHGIGISRKISDPSERKRIFALAKTFTLADGMGVVIRTAGQDATEDEMRKDFEALIQSWNEIRIKTLSASSQSVIYEEGDILSRIIRDSYNGKVKNIIVEGKKAYDKLLLAAKDLSPEKKEGIILHQGKTPLFVKYGAENQIDELLQDRVSLPSGGYLVINHTEALVAIDVNSGKATGEKNVEETATMINIEAAKEIARQLRLRDIGGLIVIDFIDMYSVKNRRTVESVLKSAFMDDKARVQMTRISILGLLELSRQRLRSSIQEISTTTCHFCKGSGTIKSSEMVISEILRKIESILSGSTVKKIEIVAQKQIIFALGGKHSPILALANQFSSTINLQESPTIKPDNFIINEITVANGSTIKTTLFEREVYMRENIIEQNVAPVKSEEKFNQRERSSKPERSKGNFNKDRDRSRSKPRIRGEARSGAGIKKTQEKQSKILGFFKGIFGKK